MKPINIMRMRPAAAGGAALWTPANLGTAPRFWSNPATAVTDAGAGACSLWEDAGTTSDDWAQSTAAERPLIVPAGLNGYRTLRGDGTADHFRHADRGLFRAATAGFVFFVWKRVVSTGGGVTRTLFFAPNSAAATRVAVYVDLVANPDKLSVHIRRLDADATTNLLGTVAVNSGWHMGLFVHNWATGAGSIYVDGTLDVTNGSLTSAGSTSNTDSGSHLSLMQANGSGRGDVELPEFIAGPYLPTAGEIEKLFGYAAHKYGLTANLDVSHPYKSVAPTL